MHRPLIAALSIASLLALPPQASAQSAPGLDGSPALPRQASGQAAPGSDGKRFESKTVEEKPPAPGACLAFKGGRNLLDDALRSLAFAVNDETRVIESVRLTGLKTLDDQKVIELVGGLPPDRLTGEQAAALVWRLGATGLFAQVRPTIRFSGTTGVLDVELVEHPFLKKVTIEGLSESAQADILEVLLQAPSQEAAERSRRGPPAVKAITGASAPVPVPPVPPVPPTAAGAVSPVPVSPARAPGEFAAGLELRCPAPVPPPEWMARAKGTLLYPGVVWRGVRDGVQRVLDHLLDSGYLMASLDAELTEDGTLTIHVDEGRIERIEIRGVAPRVEPVVREQIRLRPGQVFLRSELDGALARVRRELPFMEPDVRRRLTRGQPTVEEQAPGAGALRYRTMEGQADDGADGVSASVASVDVRGRGLAVHVAHRRSAAGTAGAGEEEADAQGGGTATVEIAASAGDGDEKAAADGAAEAGVAPRSEAWASIDGHTLVLHLKSRRVDLEGDPAELIRHTPVQSFAPGFEATGRLWDPANRVHLALELGGNVASHRGNRPAGTGAFAEPAAAQRFDFRAQPRAQVPGLGLAEIGADLHAITDTSDRWRLDRVDSYLYSMFFNRPDAEYYRRTGVDAFLTFHWFERLTAGVEYRYDRYDSMRELSSLFTVFNRDEEPRRNPVIDDGVMGSVLLRLEYSTNRVSPQHVGGGVRRTETSLVPREHRGLPRFRTVNTFEIARPGLGSDADLAFVKGISDSSAFLATGSRSGLRLRFRAAAGKDLPRQKEEALGGWTALRGYDFKELRAGNASLLGTVEYKMGELALFTDMGSLHQGDGWSPTKLGFGARVYAGDDVELAAAWRADEYATWLPQMRVYFQRAW